MPVNDGVVLHSMQCQWVAQQTQWAHRLALKLVGEYHGSLCERIAEALLKHGRQSLDEVVFTCNIQTGYEPRPRVKKDDVKVAIIYLIQMNLVNALLRTDFNHRGASIEEVLYEAALDRMLQIIRTPRFISHIRQRFSDMADQHEAIITVLLEHGKLRAEQIVLQAVADLQQRGKHVSVEQISTILQTLIAKRYIEAAPTCDLPPPVKELHKNAQKKRGAASQANKDDRSEEALLEQEQANKRAAWVHRRFFWGINAGQHTVEDTTAVASGSGATAATKRRRDNSNAASPISSSKSEGKAKRGKKSTVIADSDDDDVEVKAEQEENAVGDGVAASPIEMEEEEDKDDVAIAVLITQVAALGLPKTVWRVNNDEFNRQFRNEEVLKITARGYDETSVHVMRGLLDAASPQEDLVRMHYTPAVSSEAILHQAQKYNPSLELEDVELCLQTKLGNGDPDDPATFVSPHGNDGNLGGDSYQANLAYALGEARQLYVLAAIKERFGATAARIWDMLFIEGQLEQKAVAERAMVTKEDAREALYSMLRAGYLQMQDVPKSADHAPSRTFYTWRAEITAASANLAVDMYRSAGNLHKLVQHHIESHPDMTEKIGLVAKGDLGPETLMDAGFQRFRLVTKVLQGSLLRLDQQIALFNDYS